LAIISTFGFTRLYNFFPVGYVPNVVYTCGALLHGRELIIPYAMSDSATSFAKVSLNELLAAME